MTMPKGIYILLISGLITMFSSCSSDDTPLITIERQVDFEVPVGLNTIETHTFVLNDVPLGLKSEIATRGYNEDVIKRILAERGLIIAKFDNIDWDFVNDVSIRALSNTIPVESAEIFYQDPVPFNTNEEIRLFSNITNVKDILLNDLVDIEVKMRFRTFSPTNIEARLTISFAIFDTE